MEVKAFEPKVPPAPIFKVEVSVPARVKVLDSVNVLEVVPPAMVKPVEAAVKVRPLTVPGVMLPSPMVSAGVLVAVAQVAVTPLLAAAVETEVTVPVNGGTTQVASPLKYLVVSFGGVGIAPECVASPTGKSVLAAIESIPVVIVFFTIPVPKAPKN